ncbi:MAG: universal stress protein [Prosthecobacter sp.]|nr:universal stress protein [Prosthecobacter sp.]
MNQAPKTILAAVDFSTGSRAALEHAARLATQHQARLHVLHVMDSHAIAVLADRRGEPYSSAAANALDGGRKALNSWLAQTHLPEGIWVEVLIGAPLHEILEQVKILRADLLVAGVAGAGENASGTGSVSGKLARTSPVDVLLVRAMHPGAFKKVVACVDFSPHSQRVVAAAREVALRDGAEVDFLHVWSAHGTMLTLAAGSGEAFVNVAEMEKSGHDEQKNNMAAQLHELVKDAAQGIESREVLHEDAKAGNGIADHAQAVSAELIVIGALGRTNLRYLFLGSTAERLLARLACSVLVIKPGEA